MTNHLPPALKELWDRYLAGRVHCAPENGVQIAEHLNVALSEACFAHHCCLILIGGQSKKRFAVADGLGKEKYQKSGGDLMKCDDSEKVIFSYFLFCVYTQ